MIREILLRPAAAGDLGAVTAVYNSNREFLLHHLGKSRVDEEFVQGEWRQMRSMGFVCRLIEETDTGRPLGFLEYCPDETVYLSLLMLDQQLQREGLGTRCFRRLEEDMIRQGKRAVRIDVVNDYPGNALPFWEKQGFTAQETISLTWGEKTSRAAVMRKRLS